MKLSVIIPVYNELNTINDVITKVTQTIPTVCKEIVMIDDGSTDGTRELLVDMFGEPNSPAVALSLDQDKQLIIEKLSQQSSDLPLITVKLIFHKRNQGKGAALRTGFKESSGDVLVIQDADLEYDPNDWEKMWSLIQEDKADIVFGSRFYGNPHRVLYFHHYLGNKVITSLIDLLCNINLSDIEVCYKMFRREVVERMNLICDDFGFEVEFTVKAIKSRRRWRIYETGISYYGRTYEEGKKINWKDGVKALYYIFKFAFLDSSR